MSENTENSRRQFLAVALIAHAGKERHNPKLRQKLFRCAIKVI